MEERRRSCWRKKIRAGESFHNSIGVQVEMDGGARSISKWIHMLAQNMDS